MRRSATFGFCLFTVPDSPALCGRSRLILVMMLLVVLLRFLQLVVSLSQQVFCLLCVTAQFVTISGLCSFGFLICLNNVLLSGCQIWMSSRVDIGRGRLCECDRCQG